jgi:hypothetical protein
MNILWDLPNNSIRRASVPKITLNLSGAVSVHPEHCYLSFHTHCTENNPSSNQHWREKGLSAFYSFRMTNMFCHIFFSSEARGEDDISGLVIAPVGPNTIIQPAANLAGNYVRHYLILVLISWQYYLTYAYML